MKELFPLHTFQQDAVLKRLSELYDNEVDLDSRVEDLEDLDLPVPAVVDSGKVIQVGADGKYGLAPITGVSHLYCHPLRISKTLGDGPIYTLTALIFNNDGTPFTLSTFKAWFINLLNYTAGGLAATLLVSGYYNNKQETPIIVQSASYLYIAPNGEDGYICGCEGGNVGGTADVEVQYTDLDDLLDVDSRFVDAVNQLL